MASKYRKKFELPEGFYEILESYSREVLRDQPLDIIEFSYMYFKALEEVSRLVITIINARQQQAAALPHSYDPSLGVQESYRSFNIAACSLLY